MGRSDRWFQSPSVSSPGTFGAPGRPLDLGPVSSSSGVRTKREALCEPHHAAAATTLSAGRTHSGAHSQVSAAGGAADTAGYRPGACHAEVSTNNPAPGAADTCERRTGLSPCARWWLAAAACWPEPPSLAQGSSFHFYSLLPPPNTRIHGHCFLQSNLKHA